MIYVRNEHCGDGACTSKHIANDSTEPISDDKNVTDKQAYTYMVECSDGSLYTGWTYDLEKRMKAHNSGTGSKYTRSRLPVRLVYYEKHSDKVRAMQREYAIKHTTRMDKLRLIHAQPKENISYCIRITNEKK